MQKRILCSLLPVLSILPAARAVAADEPPQDAPFYMSLGTTRIGLSTQTNLVRGPAVLAGSVDSSLQQSLIKISAGKYVLPRWSVEASVYADASGSKRVEISQPALGQLLSAKVSTFTLSSHYHWLEPGASIRPYAGATFARASFSSEQLGAFAQANGYDRASIDSAWGLGVSAGVRAKLNGQWHMDLNYFWVPLKTQVNIGSSNPFLPAIAADFKVKAHALSMSIAREF
jgi:outer membrane protein W